MSISEGLKGAKAELQELGFVQRLSRAVKLGVIIANELFGTVLLAPYGLRAYRTYQACASLDSPAEHRKRRVTLLRDVRYSDSAERCVMDVYLPPNAAIDAPEMSTSSRAAPVALFCHGGVWSSGSKWNYAPMATRLAQEGVVVAVMHYTLYPDALAPQMIRETSTALSWTMDNAHRFGGNPDKVSVLGHSAGAHLCAMMLLKRASTVPTKQDTSKNVKNIVQPSNSDTRMPLQFIGMAGVYDIASHYEYEDARGVAKLSTMERAMGGRDCFPHMSPSNILARACHSSNNVGSISEVPSQLRGERLSLRMGLAHDPARGPLPHTSSHEFRDAPLDFAPEDGYRLPPMLLMSGLRDTTVPWYETSEFCIRLRDVGAPVKKLTYKTATHGTFVTGWQLRPTRASPDDVSDLPDACQDVVKLVTDESVVRTTVPSRSASSEMQLGSGARA